MRLIDADELTKIIENDDDFAMNLGTCIDEHLVNGFYKGYVEGQIKIMQTAYDIDKVVAELETKKQNALEVEESIKQYNVWKDAIEIVKSGGVGKDV